MPQSDRTGRYRMNWWLVSVAPLITTLLAIAVCFRLEILGQDYSLLRHADWGAGPDDIIIIAVDEDTLATLPYRSPIDRGLLADLIDQLDAADAKAVGIDFLLDQPSEPAKDRRLAEILRTASIPIVMGYAQMADGLSERQFAYQEKILNGLDKGLVALSRDDFDGTVRQLMTGRVIDGTWRPALASAMAAHAGVEPKDRTDRITYYRDATGAPFKFPVYPAHSVKHLPADWLKGKFVLIGSARPSTDQHRTPFVTLFGAERGALFGVTIHAHILAQLLRGDRITVIDGLAKFAIALALSILTAVLVVPRWPPLVRVALVLIVLGLYCIAAIYAFRIWQVMVPIATPTVAAFGSALVLAIAQWYYDRRQRLYIEKAFSRYLSPAVVRKIAANPDTLRLGGEKRDVTYVFTDLQGFTALSEDLDPGDIADLLNTYLDEICERFIDADATIDKIVGDAVIGFFGAPESQEDQASRAVDLALAIDQFSEQYRKTQAQQGIEFGITRIGIHRGEAVVGNFGGTRFFDYTGIGDTVNTAARLEAANRYLGTRICVSEAVAEACPDHAFRPLGSIVLKGKQAAIPCFEPLDGGLASSPRIATYRKAFEQLKQGEDGALPAFEDLARTDPSDVVVKMHLERLRRGENGVKIVLTEK